MQEEDGNKNLLRWNTRNQRQQVEPRRDIKNRRVRDKIYRKDAIEDGGHLSLLPNHSALLNSRPSTNGSQLLQLSTVNHQLSTFFDDRYPRQSAICPNESHLTITVDSKL